MQRDGLLKNLKIIVIFALIISLIGAVLFLVYGFAFMWQAMAATIITIFLSIMVILLIALSIYLWIKYMLIKRDINRCKEELQRCGKELEKCKVELKEKL